MAAKILPQIVIHPSLGEFGVQDQLTECSSKKEKAQGERGPQELSSYFPAVKGLVPSHYQSPEYSCLFTMATSPIDGHRHHSIRALPSASGLPHFEQIMSIIATHMETCNGSELSRSHAS
jgi:hypothetical protein